MCKALLQVAVVHHTPLGPENQSFRAPCNTLTLFFFEAQTNKTHHKQRCTLYPILLA